MRIKPHKTMEPGFYKVGELVKRKVWPKSGNPEGFRTDGVGLVLEDPVYWEDTGGLRPGQVKVLWTDTGEKQVLHKSYVKRVPVVEKIT